MIEIKQDSLSFSTVFILTAGLFIFLVAIVTVDKNSAALIGESGFFSASSPFFQGVKAFFEGVLRFARALDSPCFKLLRTLWFNFTKDFLTLFSLPELIRSFLLNYVL